MDHTAANVPRGGREADTQNRDAGVGAQQGALAEMEEAECRT